MGRLKSSRYFKIHSINNKIVNNGRYKTTTTPISVAKKVFSKLLTEYKKDTLTFCIKETTDGSQKKIYGPYLGKKKLDKKTNKYILEVKTIRKNKQKGGALHSNYIHIDDLKECFENDEERYEQLIRCLNNRGKFLNKHAVCRLNNGAVCRLNKKHIFIINVQNYNNFNNQIKNILNELNKNFIGCNKTLICHERFKNELNNKSNIKPKIKNIYYFKNSNNLERFNYIINKSYNKLFLLIKERDIDISKFLNELKNTKIYYINNDTSFSINNDTFSISKIITSNKKNLVNPGNKKNIQIGNIFRKII